MILDTNALSAWAEGDRFIEPLLRSTTNMLVPVVVLGEFEFGIRQSRHYRRYADWLRPVMGGALGIVKTKEASEFGGGAMAGLSLRGVVQSYS